MPSLAGTRKARGSEKSTSGSASPPGGSTTQPRIGRGRVWLGDVKHLLGARDQILMETGSLMHEPRDVRRILHSLNERAERLFEEACGEMDARARRYNRRGHVDGSVARQRAWRSHRDGLEAGLSPAVEHVLDNRRRLAMGSKARPRARPPKLRDRAPPSTTSAGRAAYPGPVERRVRLKIGCGMMSRPRIDVRTLLTKRSPELARSLPLAPAAQWAQPGR